ncbi:hypothetical protein PVMG_05625 [Plasmodium vivax Mauritania I]|uniref:Uncharacterized protein n=1 Tax=Plasmodium vivax Mauritania I TaxID=1035515 RepID=A0A0J9TIR4_PLAVI|nr:hypothetical protein PVMG_05625 [Plasmodium vivax Mauritania I]
MKNIYLSLLFISIDYIKIHKIDRTYLNVSYLNRLIRNFDDAEHKRCCDETSKYLQSVDESHREILKKIGCSVECVYSYLTAFVDKKLADLCKYLNLWLDEQKRIHVNVDSGINEDEWNNIEEIWNYLLKNDSSSKCKRETNRHNISHIRERKKLMTYCINRDYIRGLCEPSIDSGANISRVCHAFYKFLEDQYATFYKDDQCIDTSVEPRDYRYFISNECTLYNMSKTFPVFDSEKKTILDKDNIRTAIKECTKAAESDVVTVEVYSATTEDVGDLTKLDDVQTGLALGQDGLSVAHGRLSLGQDGVTISHAGSEGDLINPEGLDTPSIKALTSPDYKPSKPIYYAGLSVSGVFFTCMVLYKV